MIIPHNSIVTLTLCPAIDKSATVPILIPEKKLNCSAPIYEPGGGGINVARAIKRLGGNAMAIYLAGGYTGTFFTKLLKKENITTLPIKIINPTRENLVIKELSTQRQYRFGMPGPEISFTEWQDSLKAVEQLNDVEYLVISGSLPPGAPANIFSKIAEICRAKKQNL
ncbi:1-phosphofructokinase family hexose kinase [Pedobacter steynii]